LSQKPERATPPVSPAPRTTHDSGPILCTSHDIEMWAYDGPYERAEDGNAEAQFEVGQMYHLGRGLKKDPVEAALWYRKAAEQGHEEARDLLEVVNAEVKSPS
jgi:Sel1 repeat